MRWLYLYLFLIFSAFFQSLFLNFDGSPFLLWPPVFYFFLYQSGFRALFLLFFVSLLSSVFLSLSVPDLFFIYLFGFIGLKGLSFFFSYKSISFFGVWVFICSGMFFSFIEGFPLTAYIWTWLFFTLIKSFATGLIALLFFPILKKIFPISKGD